MKFYKLVQIPDTEPLALDQPYVVVQQTVDGKAINYGINTQDFALIVVDGRVSVHNLQKLVEPPHQIHSYVVIERFEKLIRAKTFERTVDGKSAAQDYMTASIRTAYSTYKTNGLIGDLYDSNLAAAGVAGGSFTHHFVGGTYSITITEA